MDFAGFIRPPAVNAFQRKFSRICRCTCQKLRFRFYEYFLFYPISFLIHLVRSRFVRLFTECLLFDIPFNIFINYIGTTAIQTNDIRVCVYIARTHFRYPLKRLFAFEDVITLTTPGGAKILNVNPL